MTELCYWLDNRQVNGMVGVLHWAVPAFFADGVLYYSDLTMN